MEPEYPMANARSRHPWRVAGVLALLILVAVAAFALLRGRERQHRGPLGDALTAISGPAAVDVDLAGYLPTLQGPPSGLPSAPGRDLPGQVRTFYQRRANAPAWFAEGRLRPEARELVSFLESLDDEGLASEPFRPSDLAARVALAEKGKVAGRDAGELDATLTWAALLAGSQLHHGRVSPQQIGEKWLVEREKVDLPRVLEDGLASGQLAETLRRLDPDHPQFLGLLQALRRYRQIAASGGWPTVPRGPVIGEGEAGDVARLRALAARLRAEGFLAAEPPELAAAAPGTRVPYPKALAEGVRAFQRTRTLEDDGKLGPETQEELNVPIGQRLRQIELNLERWRWLPDDFGQRAVLVNIPGYTLDVEEGRRITQSMRVVVGEEGWETPVFADRIRYLVLNPYWNVPASILSKEILPKLRQDPGYLAANEMEVVQGEQDSAGVVDSSYVWSAAEGGGYRVRQRPGEKNPLGKIKFMFPNKFNIYLHDTPARALFAKADRSESHGCIRVEHPIELAEHLLRDDPKWGGGQLRLAIASGQQEEVPLDSPVPVFLLYFTAGVRPGGELELYEDIYHLDAAHQAALEKLGWGSAPSDQLAGTGKGAVNAPDAGR